MADARRTYFLALAIFVVDQLSKWFILRPLNLRFLHDVHAAANWPAELADINLLPFFGFTYVENRGISLGLLTADSNAGRWLLVAMTGAIAVGVAWWIRREQQKGERVALAMVLGGALGNIVDRVRLGYVVDFLDLHFGTFRPFYVFNVADAAISIGVVILLLRAFLAGRTKNSESRSHG